MQGSRTGGLQSHAGPASVPVCHGGCEDGCGGYGCDGLCGAATISAVVVVVGGVSMAAPRVFGGVVGRAFAGGVGIVGVCGGYGSVGGMVVGLRLCMADLFLFFLGGAAEFHHDWQLLFLGYDVGNVMFLIGVGLFVAASRWLDGCCFCCCCYCLEL